MELSETRSQVRDSDIGIIHSEAQASTQQPVGQGILVVAPPMRLLYADGTAFSLLRHMSAQEQRGRSGHFEWASEFLLRPVSSICTRVFQRLRESSPGTAHEPLEVSRLLRTRSRSLRVRAFGTPGTSESSRVVLLLDQVRAPTE